MRLFEHPVTIQTTDLAPRPIQAQHFLDEFKFRKGGVECLFGPVHRQTNHRHRHIRAQRPSSPRHDDFRCTPLNSEPSQATSGDGRTAAHRETQKLAPIKRHRRDPPRRVNVPARELKPPRMMPMIRRS